MHNKIINNLTKKEKYKLFEKRINKDVNPELTHFIDFIICFGIVYLGYKFNGLQFVLGFFMAVTVFTIFYVILIKLNIWEIKNE